METSSTDHLAQAIRNGVLTIAAAFGYGWIMVNKTSEEWRLGAFALGILALLLALATVISLLSLVVGLLASGVMNGLSSSTVIFRFHAFRRLAAMLIGSAIAVGGFALVSPYDPKWGVIPAGLGFVVMQSPGLWQTVRNQPWFYRIFRSGRAPEAEFAQVYHLKKFAKPFRTTFQSNGGFCSDGLFIGTSTRESA
ncbi:hypothetical protein [Rhodopirellula baltica]|uniref:Uncharacterized protein n=1 Tax=Rhodopirellula baltica SWK14 TaxID=993516 RepID=L7CLN1_RHOBT|nr:hypothetical protein [Rhodopirellula baltica]ELP34507.1 hypothetical protein RBSWK_01517 [Rhodopirellula baltica SWK14]